MLGSAFCITTGASNDIPRPVGTKELTTLDSLPTNDWSVSHLTSSLNTSTAYSASYEAESLSEYDKWDIGRYLTYGLSMTGIHALKRPLRSAIDDVWSSGNSELFYDSESLANGAKPYGAIEFMVGNERYNVKGETGKSDSIYECFMTFNFGRIASIHSFGFVGGGYGNQFAAYDVYVSNDGENWTCVGYVDQLRRKVHEDANYSYINASALGEDLLYSTYSNGQIYLFDLNRVEGQFLRLCVTVANRRTADDPYDYNSHARKYEEFTSVSWREMLVYGSFLNKPNQVTATESAPPQSPENDDDNNDDNNNESTWWSLDSTSGELVISSNGDMGEWNSKLSAPWHSERASIKKVTIKNGVTIIGKSAFEQCSNLTSVTIPDSVTSIDDSAFWGCTSLTSLTIPNSVTSIDSFAFYNCTELTGVYISDLSAWCNISFGNYNSNPLVYAYNLYLNGNIVTDLVIPNSVTKINAMAFQGCRTLKTVRIPDNVTCIGESAFRDCVGLTGVTMGNGVTHIEEDAFRDCTALSGITLSNKLTSIGNSAFSSCSALTSISLPDTVTSMGSSVFSNCSELTSIILSKGITKIGAETFYGCRKLKDVEIPHGVLSIGSNAFSFCNALKSINIPNTVTKINDDAFSYGKLESIIYCGTENEFSIISSGIPSGVSVTYHKYDVEEIITAPTVTDEGEKKNICSLCGNTKLEKIEKLTPEETTASTTTADTTAANTTADDKAEVNTDAASGGCGSYLGGGVSVILLVSALSATTLRKKKKEN